MMTGKIFLSFRSQSVCGLRYRQMISHFSSWKLQGVTIRVPLPGFRSEEGFFPSIYKE